MRTDSGMLVTYGRMTRTDKLKGDVVGLGEPVGEIAPLAAGSLVASGKTPVLLYFGVRIGGRYVDPLSCFVNSTGLSRHAILIPDPSR